MKIVVWNLKGGQGKTVLSMAIAMLEGFYVVTNDVHSPIDEVLGEDRALRLSMRDKLPETPPEVNLIYDFGGYPDARIIEAAKLADCVIVPIIYDSPLEMQVTINALAEIEKYTDRIVVVINKAKPGDFERAQAVFAEFDYEYPIFEIKKSTAFSRAIEHKKSLQEMVDESPLFSFHYSKPLVLSKMWLLCATAELPQGRRAIISVPACKHNWPFSPPHELPNLHYCIGYGGLFPL